MSISRKQQDVIDDTISAYIKNYDKIASQYLRTRRDLFELARNRDQSAEAQVKWAKAVYEAHKVIQLYQLHLHRIETSIKAHGLVSYADQLDGQYEELEARKLHLQQQIQHLRGTQKPLVELMTKLVDDFNRNIAPKSARPRFANRPKDLEQDENRKQVDMVSAVFTQDELRGLFDEVSAELRGLRTVDEVGEELGGANVDILKYLDEHVGSHRAYRSLDDGRVMYDISKKTLADAGTSQSVVHDYDQAIAALTTNLRDLVERGAEAKERWSRNAALLELVRSFLQST